jgi:predicted nucleotidyltransferase component of viral defense system
MEKAYKKQVALLLSVLPEVAKEKCFALHGGTAINLFVREMPRLSVDIDLTYVPIEDRAASFVNIAKTLEKIKATIEATIPSVIVSHKQEIGKLLISVPGADIKLEVNQIGRGVLSEPVKMALCEKAQNDFDSYCVVPVVPLGQLYGGKICAALDRQHPRDLFDVKYLLQNEGFSDDIKKGFLLCLLSSARPIHELISPNFQDQRLAMINQFDGMSGEIFTYEEYESIRTQLVETINNNLTKADRTFLLSVKNLTPDWSVYDFQAFPAVQWKLHNLQNLQAKEPQKHKEQYEALKKILGVK